MRPEAGAALAAMVGRRAVLVGDFMLDAYLYGETVRISREAPVLVVRKTDEELRLGGAANTAANLVALGLEVELVGAVGQDAAGDALVALLTARGAHVAGLRRVARTTPVKTRVLAGAFGTSRQQVLRLDDEPQAALDAATLVALAADLARAAAGADVVVVSDYGTGTVTGPLLAAICALRGAGPPVCVDSRYQLERFVGVTAITPNVPEAEAAVGFAVHSRKDVCRAGTLLREQLACDACLLTQGNRGMTLFRAGVEPRHVDVVGDGEVTDVTGAGDTVIATLAAALAAQLGLDNAMLLANCAAGLVVARAGTAVAQPADIAAAAAAAGVELRPWASAPP